MAREQHARRWTVKRSHLFFALTSLGLVTVMILYGDVSTSIDLQLFDQDANDIEVQETANFEEIFETTQTTEVKLGMTKNFKKANNISQPFIIDTPGCRIPDLPTRPKSLLRLFKNQQVDPK
ncbi:hypothetical protein B566_EDAN004332, partial [Ephemera danica]